MNRKLAVALGLFLTMLSSPLSRAQAPDFAGTWAGAVNGLPGLAGLEITLAREGQAWKATMKLRAAGGDLTPNVEELNIVGSEISFGAVTNGVVARFKGKIDGDKLNGTFEASRSETKVGEGTFALARGEQMPSVQQAPGGPGSRSQFRRQSS